MPAYDYICDACQFVWEDIVSLAEHEAILNGPCPQCAAKHVRVQFLHAPAIKTSATWLKGQGTLADHFGDSQEGRAQLRHRMAVAQRHGRNPSSYDVYDETLALFPGDPDGFIPHDDPAGHVRRVCEQRGVSCDSSLVKVKGPDRELRLATPAPLADDIVQDLAAERVSTNPDLVHENPRELAEMIRDEHSYV